MTIKILKKLNFLIEENEFLKIKSDVSILVGMIKAELIKQKIGAEVFLGGSFAKGTLVKKNSHDIDIFVRFDWRYEELSYELEKIVKAVSKKIKLKYEKMHGSRDYFRIIKNKIYFEIIPVLKIAKPSEERNVTDLSYFHVNYVKKNVNPARAREIAIAKAFCKAQGVYGAESYIQGFSGYALECLVIYYGSFEKMLSALSKVENRLILDPEKKYKKKDDILFSLNESKLKSPIVLVDPTWRERNVLAALSSESFKKFQEKAKEFLKKPSLDFFEDKEIDVRGIEKEAKRRKDEFLHIVIETDKQAGDIAGTKLKKFTNFIETEINQQFIVKRKEFMYDEKQKADVYFVLKSKGEIIKFGPPEKMETNARLFRMANKNVFVKNGQLRARVKINYSAKRFLEKWKEKYSKKIKEMEVTEFKAL